MLTDEFAVEPETADKVLEFISVPGTRISSPSCAGTREKNETFDLGLHELATVVEYVGSFGVPAENFEIDLTIARGLDYYTGTVVRDRDDRPSGDRLGLAPADGTTISPGVLHRPHAPRRRHLHRRDAPFSMLQEQDMLSRTSSPPRRGRRYPDGHRLHGVCRGDRDGARRGRQKRRSILKTASLSRRSALRINPAFRSRSSSAATRPPRASYRSRTWPRARRKSSPGGSRGEDQRRARAAPQGAGHPRISVPDSIFKKGGGDMVAKIRSLGLQGIGGYGSLGGDLSLRRAAAV